MTERSDGAINTKSRSCRVWPESPWRILGVGGFGVTSGGVIGAMIAVTTVRPDNKSNYKDGHGGIDPAAV